jgi:hypothetical protein
MSKQILFEDLAEQIALLSESDRAEFAEFLVENYLHAAAGLATDIGHAEMNLEYGAYDTFEDYQRRENILT